MNSLPIDLQENIAAKVAAYGRLHTLNLRSCSWHWKALCGELMVASVSADKLSDSMPRLNRLPRLELLIITSKTLPAVRLAVNTLSFLHAPLRAVSLTSGCSRESRSMVMDSTLDSGTCSRPHDIASNIKGKREQQQKQNKGERGCTIVVEDIGNFLQPWYNSLVHMHLDHCRMEGMEVATLHSPSVFSKFACLHTLRIIAVQASNTAGAALTSFDLYGCKALKRLYFHGNDFADLTLNDCQSLVVIDCQNNQLTSLHSWGCARLQVVQCSNNHKMQFVSLYLHVHTLCCGGHGTYPFILGGDTLVDLRCTAYCFAWVEKAIRQRLVRLSLLFPSVRAQESGFRDLQYLQCRFGWFGLGAIDLSGCTSVELDCHCSGRRFPILGRNLVHKLSLTQLGYRQPDLVGFTALQELCFTLHKQGFVNLSACATLKKVRIAREVGKASRLSTVDVSGCSVLEEFHCDGFSTLTFLRLENCICLKSLTCTGSGLKKLDTSWSPLLTSVDVSHSLRLRVIFKNPCNAVLVVRSEGCGELLVAPTCAALSQSNGCWGWCHTSGWQRWIGLGWLCS